MAEHRTTPPTASPLSPAALEALLAASAAISAQLKLAACLQAIAEQAAKLMSADASSVLLLDGRRNKFVFKAAVGAQGQQLIGTEFDADRGIAGYVAKSRRPVLTPDVRANPHFYSDIDAKSDFITRDMVAAPLIFGDEVLGVVEVLNKHDDEQFTATDLQILQVFANLAAIGASNARSHEQLQRENLGLRSVATAAPPQMIGDSAPMRAVKALCERVAPSNATVLLLGETGTGKEVTARQIHDRSPRRAQPLIALNCAALPETLLESELFGHEAGAFTGATKRKLGRFELADGGTLFLDEIGDISAPIQIKLLRVLQEREFVRVGGTETISTDARIIAATNRDLKAAIAAGTFREDLFYRLNVFPIQLPPLRERQADLAALVSHLVGQSARELRVPAPPVAEATLAAIRGYRWPGNIRELRNVLERAVLLADQGEILPQHLPPEIGGERALAAGPASGGEAGESELEAQERALIIRTLEQQGWNQTQAAKALNITRDNLRYRLRKYGIRRPG